MAVKSAISFFLLLSVLGRESAQAFKIGVGGQFPLGYEGLIARMGLPRERILDSELCDPNALARYDVVMVCGPGPEMQSFPEIFDRYVKQGGSGVVGLWRWTPKTFFPVPMVTAGNSLNLVVVNEEHPVAQGYENGDVIPFYDHEDYSLSLPPAPYVQIPVRYVSKETTGSISQDDPRLEGEGALPALIVFPLWGEGRLIYAAAPLGFSLFWRGMNAEPLAANCVRYLVDGRVSELFAVDRHKEMPCPRVPAVEPWTWNVQGVQGFCPEGAETLAQVTGPYNLLLVLQSEEPQGGRGSLLLESHRSSPAGNQPWAWQVERRGQRILLKRLEGKQESILRHAQLTWPNGRIAGNLLIKRRRQFLWFLWRGELLFGARTPPSEGGFICLLPKKGWDEKTVRYQPVSPPYFADDFMRDPGQVGAWEPLSGTWQTVSLNHAETAANGFLFRGASQEDENAAICLAGHWFWEGYAAFVSVQCEDASTEAGLLFLVQEEKDRWAMFLRPGAPGGFKVERIAGSEAEILAEGTMDILPNVWYRVGIRMEAGRMYAYVDGRCVAKIPLGPGPCGGIGLQVARGQAQFDDVVVAPSTPEAHRLPGGEGTSWPCLPQSAAAADFCTWADRAVEWRVSSEHPGFAWHKGRFWGDFDLLCPLPRVDLTKGFRRGVHLGESCEEPQVSIVLSHKPRSSRAVVSFCDLVGRKISQTVSLSALEPSEGFRIRRQGRTLSCGLGTGQDLFSRSVPEEHTRLGISLDGPPLNPNQLRFESGHVKDYVFSVAPADWQASGGTWSVAPRWSCDQRWSWLSGWSEETAAIWHKDVFCGDLIFDVYMGIKMKAPGGDERQRCRDLNLSLFGDGRDPLSGYAFVFGGHGGVVTSLWRKGERVCQNPSVWVPREYAMHHQWFHVQMERRGDQVVCRFEDREILRYRDKEPLSEGYVGLWTRNSGISVPRATIYFENKKD